VVNVSGAGSTLFAYHLSVGANPDATTPGRLNITDGGTVYTSTVGGIQGFWIGFGTGAATVDGIGSSLINQGGGFSVSSSTSATLMIRSGATVSSQGNGAYIGGDPWGSPTASTGSVTVDGAGSTLNIVGECLTIGYHGSGTLTVVRGSGVTTATTVIGSYAGSNGLVRIDGAGSTWANSGDISVGSSGAAMVTISGGGAVSSGGSITINGTSLLSIDVGNNSSLAVGAGTGSIANNGVVRIVAGAGVAADGTEYAPIAAGTWAGTGTYQAVGGTWSSTTHKFTASSVASGKAGVGLVVDLATVQRTLIDDDGLGGTNWQVGASFVKADSTKSVTFTAAVMADTILGTLGDRLSAKETILSGWMFSAEGYDVTASNPVYLSFKVDADQLQDGLEVWHYDSTDGWEKYDAFDLTYDGNYASFTATSFSGYAMVAVPEPCTLLLLALGMFGIAGYVRQRRRAA
jgi:T5SS/PEP-CTERM-associated repeat protein